MKKVLSIVLCTVMLLSLFVLPTSAAAWNGTDVSTSLKGEGTAEKPYLVESGADLALISQTVAGGESYAGKYFKQTCDIDMGGKNFAPIGNRDGSKPFCGLFNGGGYTITNFYQSFQYRFGGLFGWIITAENFTPGIINVNLVGKMDTVTRSGDIYSGAILGWSQRSGSHPNKIIVANCTTDVDMVFDNTGKGVTGDVIVAPVFARTGYADVINCTNYGDVTVIGDGSKVTAGGVVGYQVDCNVSNCVNYGKVTVDSTSANKEIYAGGVVGALATSTVESKLENSVNYGEVDTSSAKANYTGGVVGCVSNANGTLINNCANVAVVNSVSSSAADLPYAGGILGYTNRTKVVLTNNYNSGAIATKNENKTGHNPGGIAGVLNNATVGSTYAKDCLTTTASFKGWFNGANTAEGCEANVDAAVIADKVKAIVEEIAKAESATLNGSVFVFEYPAPVLPDTPIDPDLPVNPNPGTGDATVLFVIVAVIALAGVVVTKKVSVR